MYTHTLIRSYFNCFAGAIFSKQSEDLLKSCSVHSEIHGFILLKERLTCSRTIGWGQLKMMLQKRSSHPPRGQKEGKDAWPACFDLTRVFSWEEEAAGCTAPSCGQEVHQQPGPHSQAEQKNQNVRAGKYLRKKSNPPIRMKLRSRGDEVAELRVHSQLLADEMEKEKVHGFPFQ